MDNMTDYWIERLAAKKGLLIIWEEALEKALASGAQEYTLDTGQGKQNVRKFSVTQLRNQIAKIESEIATLYNRIYGCGVLNMRGSNA